MKKKLQSKWKRILALHESYLNLCYKQSQGTKVPNLHFCLKLALDLAKSYLGTFISVEVVKKRSN